MSTEQNAVTAEPGNGPAAIRARVGDSAIDKVTRLFSAGLADIFIETLQNSRRGGANRNRQNGVPPPATLNGGTATASRPRSTNPSRTRAKPQASKSRCRSQGRSKGAGRPRGPPSPQLIQPTCQPGACQ